MKIFLAKPEDDPIIKAGIEIRTSLHSKLKSIAALKRKKLRDVVEEALAAYPEQREPVRATCPHCHSELAVAPDGVATIVTIGKIPSDDNRDKPLPYVLESIVSDVLKEAVTPDQVPWIQNQLQIIFKDPRKAALFIAVLQDIDSIEDCYQHREAQHGEDHVDAAGAASQQRLIELVEKYEQRFNKRLGELENMLKALSDRQKAEESDNPGRRNRHRKKQSA